MLEAYHYIYQAVIRCQIALGGSRGKYTEWKAGVALVVLDCWWAMIVGSWIRIELGYNLLFDRSRVPLLLVAALLVLINQLCLSSKEVRAKYETQFQAWPKSRRKVWDVCVGIFVLLTFALMFYTVKKYRAL